MQPPFSSSPGISIGGSPPPRGGRTGSLRLKQNDVIIAGAGETPSSFSLMITGQIVCAQTSSSSPLPLMNNQKMYCRYSFVYGDDWSVTSGVTEGISQIANSRRAIKNADDEKGCLTVWNFPIEISFQSTNMYGWPRLCLSVYGIDFLGRDVVRGYASILLPIRDVHTKYAKMYRPVNGNGTSWQQFIAKLTGTKNPEFDDNKITARGEGRASTRVVRSENNLTLKINLMTTRKDFQSFGYKSSL
jgi:B9 domain-containing protein 1